MSQPTPAAGSEASGPPDGGDSGDGGSVRLPLATKLFFGAPAFAGAAMAIPIAVLMPRFYSDVVLAPLGGIAIAIALARAFDAITDPVMGWLSDRTRSRFGRRKPYIAFGVPLMALAFYGLFSPPAALSGTDAALWFAGAFALFFLFSTIVEIPYSALGAEVTPDYAERSSLFGWRALFIAAGTITAALLPTVLARSMDDERAVYSLMAGLYAVLLLVLNVGLLWRVREHPEYAERTANPLIPGVRRALRNRPFRILLLAGVVSAIPAAIPAILMPYYVGYVLQPPEPAAATGLYLTLYLGSGLLCVPLWIAVARKAGKLFALVAASAVGIAGSLFFFAAGPGDLLYAGLVYAATGTVSMAGNFLVPAMAADVIDYDELRTGKRREAQYTSFWALIPKFVAIPGSSVPLAVLAAVGYVPNQPQDETVMFAIRFMYSIFPAVFYLAALLIVSRYPISEAVHSAIRHGIAQRNRGEAAVDPLTGAPLHARGAGRVGEDEGWFLDHFSPGELRRALVRGPGAVAPRVALATAGSLGLCAAASAVAWGGVSADTARLPLTTVLAVVTAGLALTAALFHGIRLVPAQRLRRTPPAEAVIRAHLEGLER